MASSSVDPGDTSWMLTSTALVLTMSPALAFFQSGLLRSKNTLSIYTQIFSGVIVLCSLWFIVGYSLTFGETAGVIGSPLQHALFLDVSYTEPSVHAPAVPAAVFALFQMMFATITPLLITGAYAERMPFRVFLLFSCLFSLLVYYPVAHSVWAGGFLQQLGVLDFAGGITIHTTAGVAALVSAAMIGRRLEFELYHGDFPPSNLPLAGIGAALLWTGWFGFNGGSALNARGGIAVSACVSTCMGAVSSGLVWLLLAWWRHKPASAACMNGLIAGLAGITPASGYINSPASFLLGCLLGLVSYGGALLIKGRLRIDDALDVGCVHGLTGIVGSLWIGLFSQLALNPAGADGLLYGGGWRLLLLQLLAVTLAAAWSGFMSFLILSLCHWLLGSIRVSAEEEEVGCDWSEHGEVAYHKLQLLDDWERQQHTALVLSEREQRIAEDEQRKAKARQQSALSVVTVNGDAPPQQFEYEEKKEAKPKRSGRRPAAAAGVRVRTEVPRRSSPLLDSRPSLHRLQSPLLSSLSSQRSPPVPLPRNDSYRQVVVNS